MMEGVVQHNLIYVKFGVFYWHSNGLLERTLENILYIFINGEAEAWPKKCSPAEEKNPGPEVHYKCIPVTSFTVPSSII